MIMTSSPLLSQSSHPHSPLNISPNQSPSLRPVAGTMTKPIPPQSALDSEAPIQGQGQRSYARAPTVRPYQSPRVARASISAQGKKEIGGDIKKFADKIAASLETSNVAAGAGGVVEAKRAELIVDIPVWSPGCFQDLSTLHALRDTTLSHTHSILAYLSSTQSTSGTYRLLARSTGPSSNHGWGCIRLNSLLPLTHQSSSHLRKVRRASLVEESLPKPGHGHGNGNGNGNGSLHPIAPRDVTSSPSRFDNALVDDDEEDEVQLKEGYLSGVGSEEEEEEETADETIAREVRRRGSKDGMVFLITLFGQPALILT